MEITGHGTKGASDYYIGLDIGTASVGWAVTDPSYELVKKHRKNLWGVRLFDTANTAEERRLHRSARRRHQRKLQRLRILREIFDRSIAEVDPQFFTRLRESLYHADDRSGSFISTLFDDDSFKDSDYHKKFPTIFHLRSHLLHHPDEKPDIRMLYLAIHSILKNRGHFLIPGETLDTTSSLYALVDNLQRETSAALGCTLEFSCPPEDLGMILKMRRKSERKSKLTEISTLTRITGDQVEENPKRQATELIKALAGTPFMLSALFSEEAYQDHENNKIEFDTEGYEESKDAIEVLLEPEEFALIEAIEGLRSWALLSDILHGEAYISDAKTISYAEHKEDLKKLKRLVKAYVAESFIAAFKDPAESNNYAHYVGTGNKSGVKVQVIHKSKCSQDDVNKYFEGLLKPFKNNEDDLLVEMLGKLEIRSALPKQRVRDNRVIPHQLHKKELEVILAHAKRYYPFLSVPDADGYSAIDKIMGMMTFRIPYYVGPLNTAHLRDEGKEGFCWMVRQQGKEQAPILPWNWEDVVDKNASAEKFISRMTNACTYLFDQKVLPKYSLLYNRFMVLNELNNLKVNGEPVTVELKQRLYTELFLESGKKKIAEKMLKKFLLTNNIINRGDEVLIEGIDQGFTNSLKSHIDFSHYLNEKILTVEEVEQIIEWKAFYVDDTSILREKITEELGRKLSEDQISEIIQTIRSYKGWGRLSRVFLEEVYHEIPATGEVRSIIQMMWETNNNLMKLLSSEFDFLDETQRINNEKLLQTSFSYDTLVKPLAVSPPVKRQIWQTLLIVRELRKVMGKAPRRVFVEMARERGEKVRTTSRKQTLVKLYENCKNDIGFNKALLETLEEKTDAELRNDRLYFYYTQMGRCPYCGGRIEIEQMHNPQLYDIDHIYPQSLIKDDSLNNRVLSHKTCNGNKGGDYPINPIWQEKMHGFWKMLLTRELISAEKFKRLTRTTSLSDDELFAFINRQLVETRQSTKVVSTILKNLFQDDDTEIIYVKARNVSNFRTDFEIKKSRLVNDHHHAHDAYLNIVVGNTYHTRFTDDPRVFIKELRRTNQNYNASNLFTKNVERNGKIAWIADEEYWRNRGRKKREKRETGTILTIRETLRNHQVLITRQSVEASGALFKLQPLRKKQNLIPLKGSDPKLYETTKYGGYNAASTAYFALVEHIVKKKPVRSLVPIPIQYAQQFKLDSTKLVGHCTEHLHYDSPNLVLERILLHEMVCVQNFFMSLSGITGSRVVANNEVQLVLSEQYYDYFSQVEKYLSLLKKVKASEVLENAEILAEDLEITREANLALYDLLLAKERDSIFRNRPANQAKLLTTKQSLFTTLDIKTQCEVLVQILNLFTCTPESADLKVIGGGGRTGIVLFQSQIKDTNAQLIHRSPTGIFSKSVRVYDL